MRYEEHGSPKLSEKPPFPNQLVNNVIRCFGIKRAENIIQNDKG